MNDVRDDLVTDDRIAFGLDVGSTTVKVVAVDPRTGAALWQDYQPHETRQAAKVAEVLAAALARFGEPAERYRLFLTGSGAAALVDSLGGRYVQEVNAVALAVERLHPEAGAVVELGGQDAKLILWVTDPATGVRRRFATMNDRCAGGTGAVLDKIRTRLGLDAAAAAAVRYDPARLHPVAGKCGVFAETDVVGLLKQGVPADELLASLCDAIVQQNLRVLTRGHVLRPVVLLLGGPHEFLPALREAWRANLHAHWRERGVSLPPAADPEQLVVRPAQALYFPALGAVLHGLAEGAPATFAGLDGLRRRLDAPRAAGRALETAPLVASAAEAERFARSFAPPAGAPFRPVPGATVPAYVGLDAGSTSTKGVLLAPDGRLLATAYRLSAGNPVDDVKAILGALRAAVAGPGATLRVEGVGVTGYAKDLIRDVIGADVAVVETVAHAESAVRLWPEVEVVCDVGGQDIKVLFIRRGRIWDFRLNTQCSAGNGYFLQATARRFGLAVEDFAAAAFAARRAPLFHAGCAVFLESDIVNAQQLGWTREEILAGLAQVLPRNIWLYVVQEPNLARFGRRFLLQGGTQRNLAALKAQVDFIRARVPEAEIRLHDHPGEGGAIGAALEARRVRPAGGSAFLGFDAVQELRVEVTRDESTRCRYCRNACVRTLVRATAPDGTERRLMIATCERGAQEDPARVREAHRRLRAALERAPDLVERAAERAFQRFAPAAAPARRGWLGGNGRGPAARERLRVGIPRVLNLYSVAPFFTAYLEALGVPFAHLVFSDVTSEALYRAGSRRGAVDPCFPVKVALAHVHQLLRDKGADLVFFPRLVTLPTFLEGTRDSMACPSVAAAPDVVRAALTRGADALAPDAFVTPTLHMAEPGLFARQLFEAWRPRLGLAWAEHTHAVREGWRALDRFLAELRAAGQGVLARLEAEGGLGVVILGRPYHNDPGINQRIVEEIRRLGYPVLPIEALPLEGPWADRHCAWAGSFSENTNRKLWGARYAARHPNLVAVDLSSFKCGHDAPIFDVVERALEETGTPYFAFHELDENRPAGAIKLRVETLGYFLARHAAHGRRAAEADRAHRAPVPA